MEGRSFWDIKIPSKCSWCWCKILKYREKARSFIKHKVGNGESTFLWFDLWHPLSPLITSFGDRVIYDSVISRNAKVTTVIQNSIWHWPISNSNALIDIKNSMRRERERERERGREKAQCSRSQCVCSITREVIQASEIAIPKC